MDSINIEDYNSTKNLLDVTECQLNRIHETSDLKKRGALLMKVRHIATFARNPSQERNALRAVEIMAAYDYEKEFLFDLTQEPIEDIMQMRVSDIAQRFVRNELAWRANYFIKQNPRNSFGAVSSPVSLPASAVVGSIGKGLANERMPLIGLSTNQIANIAYIRQVEKIFNKLKDYWIPHIERPGIFHTASISVKGQKEPIIPCAQTYFNYSSPRNLGPIVRVSEYIVKEFRRKGHDLEIGSRILLSR
ncbi:hypothetical protein FJZ18_02105 [Candidatus Pacearchaeota archaeon]|nr:hypothetical protein [Candidatus Pacearchaeota archaeon]